MIGSTSIAETKPSDGTTLITIAAPAAPEVVISEEKPAAVTVAEVPLVEVKKAEERPRQKDKKSQKTVATSPKKKSISCFSTKKEKIQKLDKQKAPTAKTTAETGPKPAEVQVKIDSQPSPSKLGADVILPPSNWSIGLDRAAHLPVVKREPETKKKEESLTKEIKIERTPVEIEIPSVIDATLPTVTIKEDSLAKEAAAPVKLTIDSPGAYVKLDREPDHAVIPIVTQPTVVKTVAPVTLVVEEAKPAETGKKIKTKEKAAKKTSPIDMPLIDILVPKGTAAPSVSIADKKEKKKKKKKEKDHTDEVRIELNTSVSKLQNLMLK